MKWYAKDLNNIADQGLIIDEETGKNIAVAYDKKDMDLIAAAPELLEALKAAIAALSQNKIFPADIKAAKKFLNNAIANAEGK